MIQIYRPPPPKPGEVLQAALDALEPVSQDVHAKRLGMTRTRLNEILNSQRAITVDSALRLARYLGTPPEHWMDLQTKWDLYQAQMKHAEMRKVEAVVPAGGEFSAGEAFVSRNEEQVPSWAAARIERLSREVESLRRAIRPREA